MVGKSCAPLLPSISALFPLVMQHCRVRFSVISAMPWRRSLSAKQIHLTAAHDPLVPTLGELVQKLRALPSSTDKKVRVSLSCQIHFRSDTFSSCFFFCLTGPGGSQSTAAAIAA